MCCMFSASIWQSASGCCLVADWVNAGKETFPTIDTGIVSQRISQRSLKRGPSVWRFHQRQLKSLAAGTMEPQANTRKISACMERECRENEPVFWETLKTLTLANSENPIRARGHHSFTCPCTIVSVVSDSSILEECSSVKTPPAAVSP